jgi:hypothetical protein
MNETEAKVYMAVTFVSHALITLGLYTWCPGRVWFYYLLSPLIIGAPLLIAIGISLWIDGIKRAGKLKIPVKGD